MCTHMGKISFSTILSFSAKLLHGNRLSLGWRTSSPRLQSSWAGTRAAHIGVRARAVPYWTKGPIFLPGTLLHRAITQLTLVQRLQEFEANLDEQSNIRLSLRPQKGYKICSCQCCVLGNRCQHTESKQDYQSSEFAFLLRLPLDQINLSTISKQLI